MYVAADIGMRSYGGYGIVRHILGVRRGEANPHIGSRLGHQCQKRREINLTAVGGGIAV